MSTIRVLADIHVSVREVPLVGMQAIVSQQAACSVSAGSGRFLPTEALSTIGTLLRWCTFGSRSRQQRCTTQQSKRQEDCCLCVMVTMHSLIEVIAGTLLSLCGLDALLAVSQEGSDKAKDQQSPMNGLMEDQWLSRKVKQLACVTSG